MTISGTNPELNAQIAKFIAARPALAAELASVTLVGANSVGLIVQTTDGVKVQLAVTTADPPESG